MKDKILFLVIGFLVGAIVTAGGFLIYLKTTDKAKSNIPNDRNFSQMMKDGEFNFDENMKSKNRKNNSTRNEITPQDSKDGEGQMTPPDFSEKQNGETPPEKPADINENEKPGAKQITEQSSSNS